MNPPPGAELRRPRQRGVSQQALLGAAAPLFVLGDAVRGGIYGEPPDLNQLDNYGNLQHTTDFRSVYATILQGWLGAPASAILGGVFGSQSFLTTGA